MSKISCFLSLGLLMVPILLPSFSRAAYRGPTTAAGLNLIKEFEGFRANFYKDPVGIRTIGYGHACHVGNKCAGIHAPISEAQGTDLLRADVKSFENCVNSHVKFGGLNDVQFDALVSFSFNLGCGNLSSSTLLKKLNAGDVHGASVQFKEWVHAGGRVLAGLVRRREAERKMFCSKGGC